MKRFGWPAASCVLLAMVSGCQVEGPSLSDDGPERDCTAPSLEVVGHAHRHGPLPIRLGRTLRLSGRDFTDDCAADGAGTGVLIRRDQIVLQSQHQVGALATVHPRGPHAAFSVAITIPSTTGLGPARLFDSAGLTKGGIRLVVRR